MILRHKIVIFLYPDSRIFHSVYICLFVSANTEVPGPRPWDTKYVDLVLDSEVSMELCDYGAL